MTNLAPLWMIEETLQALVDSVDTCPPELRAELEARIAEYVGQEVEKVDRVNAVLSSLEQMARHAKVEIERLRARQVSAEKARDRLEEYILHVMRERDGRPLKGKNVTFSVRRSEAVVIDDANQIPDQFKRVTVTVDVPKIPIREAIKAGTFVPGAHVEEHENLVRR